MMLASIWIALACALLVVQADRTSMGLKFRHVQNLMSARLQHNATRKSLLRQPESPEFFSHDSEKMSEINGAHHDISGDTDTRYSGRFTKGLPPKDAKCHPKCLWKCGGGCDQVCTPVCAPPKCETSCPPLESEGCHMQCGPPKCAVVCPTNQCEGEDCPDCKTICGPPDCHTVCATNCESRCADPQCTWNCRPDDKCVQPQCKLDCDHPKVCNLDRTKGTDIHHEDFTENTAPDQSVMATGLASLDPTSIEAPAGTPPPGAVVPYNVTQHLNLGAALPTEPFGPGPVKGAWLPGQEAAAAAPPGTWKPAIWFPGALPVGGAVAPKGAGPMLGAAQPANLTTFKPCCGGHDSAADYSIQDPAGKGKLIR